MPSGHLTVRVCCPPLRRPACQTENFPGLVFDEVPASHSGRPLQATSRHTFGIGAMPEALSPVRGSVRKFHFYEKCKLYVLQEAAHGIPSGGDPFRMKKDFPFNSDT